MACCVRRDGAGVGEGEVSRQMEMGMSLPSLFYVPGMTNLNFAGLGWVRYVVGNVRGGWVKLGLSVPKMKLI